MDLSPWFIMLSMTTNLTIGKLAKKAGVNVDTVRYYERRHLLEKPTRTPSGYRQYLPEVVTRIRFIKRAQELGFSLNEIDELLKLRIDADSACDDVKARAEIKVADIQSKIQSLERIQNTLAELIDHCDLRRPTESCPILNALEDELGEAPE